MAQNRVHLVNYATKRFVPSQRLLNYSALQNGIDQTHAFRPSDIEPSFVLEQRAILNQVRGAGFWLWKPYFILKVLGNVEPGATVFYMDTGIEVIKNLEPLTALCAANGGILLFGTHGQPNYKWTKRDCFALLDCDKPHYWHADQVMGGLQVFRNSRPAVTFVAEWLHACADARLLTDLPNTSGLDNLPGFCDHRHDQSVLSLIALRNNITVHRDPTQFGNHLKFPDFRQDGEWLAAPYSLHPLTNSPYGTLLDHHRGTRGLPPPAGEGRNVLQRIIGKLSGKML